MANVANVESTRAARHVARQPRIRPTPTMLRYSATVTLLAGAFYLVWRCTHLPTGTVAWLALPALAVEAYAYGFVAIFAAMVWQASRAPALPPAAPSDYTTDVFLVASDDDALPLVAASLRAASRLTTPHTTYLLDATTSPSARALAHSYSCECVALPSGEHEDLPVAGGALLTAALESSMGEFVLLLRAGHIPDPNVLSHGLGAFSDSRVGYVQLRRDARLSGNGAPAASGALDTLAQLACGATGTVRFEGTAALVRREALLRLGATLAERRDRARAKRLLDQLRSLLTSTARSDFGAVSAGCLAASIGNSISAAAHALRSGARLDDALRDVVTACAAAGEELAGLDLAALRRDLELPPDASVEELICGRYHTGGFRLTHLRLSSLAALGAVRLLVNRTVEERARAAKLVASVPLTGPDAMWSSSLTLQALGWRGMYLPSLTVAELAAALRGQSTGAATAGFPAARALRDQWNDFTRLEWSRRLVYLAPVYCSFYRLAAAALMAIPILALGAGPNALGVGSGMFMSFALYLVSSLLLLSLVTRSITGCQSLAAELSRLMSFAPHAAAVARVQIVALVTLLSSVALGGLRLSRDPGADVAATLGMAALAIIYAWLLWRVVGPLLVSAHPPAASVGRTSTIGICRCVRFS